MKIKSHNVYRALQRGVRQEIRKYQLLLSLFSSFLSIPSIITTTQDAWEWRPQIRNPSLHFWANIDSIQLQLGLLVIPTISILPSLLVVELPIFSCTLVQTEFLASFKAGWSCDCAWPAEVRVEVIVWEGPWPFLSPPFFLQAQVQSRQWLPRKPS